MKKLFETFQNFITEAAMGLEDVVEQDLIVYYEEKSDGDLRFFLSKRGSTQDLAEIEIQYLPTSRPPFNVTARMDADDKTDTYGECLRGWQVIWSQAEHGYGPFIYDVAMEYASANGFGLTCDRAVVSKDAFNIWQYYLEKRTDVKSVQMDDLKNTLTPTEKDNCMQISADQLAPLYGGQGFPRSPLSRMYKKEGMTTIKKLKELGRFKQEIGYDAMDHIDYGDEL